MADLVIFTSRSIRSLHLKLTWVMISFQDTWFLANSVLNELLNWGLLYVSARCWPKASLSSWTSGPLHNIAYDMPVDFSPANKQRGSAWWKPNLCNLTSEVTFYHFSILHSLAASHSVYPILKNWWLQKDVNSRRKESLQTILESTCHTYLMFILLVELRYRIQGKGVGGWIW
jgi:hypothetical protein